MSNAEQDTGQKKQEQEQSEWDTLADPFDVRNIENPTQDDLSYEAWLKSNANPDQLDIDGNPTTPFDTSKIENPTQDDLPYEAWLKSNANPDFPTDRDGNPNKHYEGPAAAETPEEVAGTAEVAETAETEDGREFDPAKSRWSQMTDQEKEDLLHKYPRQAGEKTNDWGKRIEASEGVRIFGVEKQAPEEPAEPAAEAEPATTEEPIAEVEPVAEDDAAEGIKETSSAEESVAEEPSEETGTEETTEEASEEAVEAPAEETTAEKEAGQEDAEKLKNDLLGQLGGGKMAEWVENEKKLTRGAMRDMSVEQLQGLVDEYNAGHKDDEAGLEGVAAGEDIKGENGAEGSLAGQPADMPPVVEVAAPVAEAQAEEVHAEEASAKKTEAATETEAGVEDFGEAVDKLNGRIDEIRNFQTQSSVWEGIQGLLEKCGDGVKAAVKHARQERFVERSKGFLEGYRRELRSLPLFTLPWSEARMRKDSLRSVIKTSETSLRYNEELLAKMAEALPEELSDEEQAQVDSFYKMDMRMTRINADLHIRGDLGGIGMREKWIRDQEKSIADDNGGEGAPSVAKREAFIAKTRGDIAEIQARIDNYQKANPNFVLHSGLDYKNPSFEDLNLPTEPDKTPDVVVDEDLENIEDEEADGAEA